MMMMMIVLYTLIQALLYRNFDGTERTICSSWPSLMFIFLTSMVPQSWYIS